MQGGELPLFKDLDEPSGVAGARARPHAGAALHQQSFKELGFARLDPSDSSVKARSGAGPRMCSMVADTTGEHGAGMTGHSDAAAQHVEGGADGAPARTRPEYDHEGLESLVGFLSVTDSQRLRKAGGAAPDKERLAQRANAEEWRLRSEEVETLERIGSGQCAEVYKARWRGMYAVAKVLKGASDYREGWTLDTARDDLVHEISVLSHLRHPNLVLFLGAVLQQDNVILLNEYMDGGNLEEFVTQLKKRHAGSRAHVPRKQCARWGIDLGQALTFLHACSPPVIHRDLKPANLLLSSDGRLKVGDFGLSSAHRRGVAGDSYVMTGRTGTIRYMAPEAMLVDEQGYRCTPCPAPSHSPRAPVCSMVMHTGVRIWSTVGVRVPKCLPTVCRVSDLTSSAVCPLQQLQRECRLLLSSDGALVHVHGGPALR